MSNELFNSLTTIALAIIGLAVIATLVSKSANTAGVLASAASGLGGAISAAEAPVSGNSFGNFGLSSNGAGFQIV